MGSFRARVPGIPDLTEDEKEEVREYIMASDVFGKPMSFFTETADHFQKKFNKTVVEGHIQRQFCELLAQGRLEIVEVFSSQAQAPSQPLSAAVNLDGTVDDNDD